MSNQYEIWLKQQPPSIQFRIQRGDGEIVWQAACKEQELFVSQHIKGGALDGCMCEPCISVRYLISFSQDKRFMDV